MNCRRLLALTGTVACLAFGGIRVAEAQCTIPNVITNGQVADATPLMGDFSALVDCIENPAPVPSKQFSGPGGGVITMQNPSSTSDYNFNLPATAGNPGDLLTSGGGGTSPELWTSTGTSGHVLPFLDGGNTWSGTQTFGAVVGSITTQSGTAYILAASDCGTTIRFTSNSPVTVTTLNSLPPGCSVAIEQAGNGQIAIAAGAGTTQRSPHSYTKTYGPYAILGLFVDMNAGGSAAEIIITGDGA
ncbi:hypothetical protein ASC97_23570 [Rhizobium sp. Root1203]|uniref:hypothetical protein n=1 Tax=Rhizobium sp. Root1203 TaxID=1736427 RepID=UPI00070CBF7F|nr:hypothetical protein [Rhizobium sp. Root1203]KQV29318.1 hypothetical protein ASC97_23570 [Rhizobium sp. Root1203]